MYLSELNRVSHLSLSPASCDQRGFSPTYAALLHDLSTRPSASPYLDGVVFLPQIRYTCSSNNHTKDKMSGSRRPIESSRRCLTFITPSPRRRCLSPSLDLTYYWNRSSGHAGRGVRCFKRVAFLVGRMLPKCGGDRRYIDVLRPC